jgi:hypothetical protein
MGQQVHLSEIDRRPLLPARPVASFALVFGVILLSCFASVGTHAQSSGCPPYPSFPDASCTGWQHTGVTLTAYTGPSTITTTGTVIDGKQINGELRINANNVTVRRSRINGRIFTEYSNRYTGILLEDVEIDGGNTTLACLGPSGFSARRVHIRNCAQGINSSGGFTLEDSYIHDIYGTGDVHAEAVLGAGSSATHPIRLIHNELRANWNSATGGFSGGGGMSASVALYTHPTFWSPQSDILLEKNRLSTPGSGAVYCLYPGSDSPAYNRLTNSRFVDNVFVKYTSSAARCGTGGTVSNPTYGTAVCASNNRLDDGTPVSFSGAAQCSGSTTPPAPGPPTNVRILISLLGDHLLSSLSSARSAAYTSEHVQPSLR